MHLYVCIYIYIHTSGYMCLDTNLYMYIHKHLHICIYTQIHFDTRIQIQTCRTLSVPAWSISSTMEISYSLDRALFQVYLLVVGSCFCFVKRERERPRKKGKQQERKGNSKKERSREAEQEDRHTQRVRVRARETGEGEGEGEGGQQQREVRLVRALIPSAIVFLLCFCVKYVTPSRQDFLHVSYIHSFNPPLPPSHTLRLRSLEKIQSRCMLVYVDFFFWCCFEKPKQ